MRLRRPARPTWIALVTALLCLAVVAILASRSFRLPWQDSFATGDSAGWQAFGGAWSLYQGGIRNNSDERGAKFVTGSSPAAA